MPKKPFPTNEITFKVQVVEKRKGRTRPVVRYVEVTRDSSGGLASIDVREMFNHELLNLLFGPNAADQLRISGRRPGDKK